MAHGEVEGEELTVEGAVLELELLQLSAEEGKRPPSALHALFKDSPHGNVGGIRGEGDWSARLRVCEEGGTCKCCLGVLKGRCHLAGPVEGLLGFATGGGLV